MFSIADLSFLPVLQSKKSTDRTIAKMSTFVSSNVSCFHCDASFRWEATIGKERLDDWESSTLVHQWGSFVKSKRSWRIPHHTSCEFLTSWTRRYSTVERVVQWGNVEIVVCAEAISTIKKVSVHLRIVLNSSFKRRLLDSQSEIFRVSTALETWDISLIFAIRFIKHPSRKNPSGGIEASNVFERIKIRKCARFRPHRSTSFTKWKGALISRSFVNQVRIWSLVNPLFNTQRFVIWKRTYLKRINIYFRICRNNKKIWLISWWFIASLMVLKYVKTR